VTHAQELQKIKTAEPPSDQASPPLGGSFEPGRDSSSDAKPSGAPAVPTQDLSSMPVPSTTSDSPINPAVESTEPAPILSTSPSVVVASPGPVDTDSKVPSVTPTVAETGESSSGAVPQRYESAEEAKKRLEREEREKLLHGQTPGYGESSTHEHEGDTPPPYQDI